jgi:hypothetical protein
MTPGKPYRPSNGSEGEGFICAFCDRCIHEKWNHTQKTGDKQCDILSATMIYDLGDADYPKEWVYDSQGNPTCTSHVPWDWGDDDEGRGLNEPPTPEPEDPNQLCLPFQLEEIETNVVEPQKEFA